MHEIYLVKNIFDRIQEEFPEKYEDVSSVHLKVGLLSNVQPILIQNAYKAYVMECPEFYHTELVSRCISCIDKMRRMWRSHGSKTE